VRMKLKLSKLGLGSPSRFPKFQSLIVGVKTPCIGVLFISLKSYWSVDVENALAWTIWTSKTQVIAKRKVGNWPNPGECKCSAIHHWKAFEESYNFVSDLIPIGGVNKELWPRKVLGVQTGTILGFLLGSPKTKSHSDVGAVERRKEYYMGEDGGFPWIRAVVSLVSPELPVACPSIKGAPENELTNLLVGFDASSSK